MRLNNSQKAFLSLVRAGLWEQEVHLLSFQNVDLKVIYRLSQEQSVLGLVAAGLEHVSDVILPKEEVLTFVGEALQLEQRNIAMNYFIGVIVEKMRKAGIYTLLVKGQGIAQCYERPLWVACGDVDFFLSKDNYPKAYELLAPLASRVDEEHINNRHIALCIDPWEVELHGTLHSNLWRSIDAVVDKAQEDVFYGGAVRSWMNGGTQVFLPRIDEDVIFVFTHILQHFYKEGIGLRQICDWCRLLWTYKGAYNSKLLESRLQRMGIMSEWKAFAYLAVNTLGMSEEAMPFYDSGSKWSRKSIKILSFILETGNFGHNRDYSYYEKYPYVVYKAISLWRHTGDCLKYLTIFPLDSIKIWISMIRVGFSFLAKRK